MLTFALILHIYDLTKSLTTISLVMIASAIPSVIFGPFAGALSDKVRYKKILIYTNILRFLVILILIPFATNTLAILELIFLLATITQFFAPAELSSLPLIVNKNQLVGANSIYMTTMYGALIFGYGLAGPLQALVGSSWLFFIIAMLYIVSAGFIWLMSDYDQKEISARLTLTNLAEKIISIWKLTKSGIKYIIGRRNIYSPMLKLSIGWAMLGAFIVVLPGFAENVINISTKLAGLILIVPAGIGMLIASYFLHKKSEISKTAVINSSFIICGITLFIFSLYSFFESLTFSLLIAIALMIILGFSAACIYISSQTLLHLNSDEKMRGRVFGIAAMLISLALSIPALVVGGIADLTSTVVTLLLVSLTIIFYGISLIFDEE